MNKIIFGLELSCTPCVICLASDGKCGNIDITLLSLRIVLFCLGTFSSVISNYWYSSLIILVCMRTFTFGVVPSAKCALTVVSFLM